MQAHRLLDRCDVVERQVLKNVQEFNPEPFPANGIYTLDSCHTGDIAGDFIKSHRLTGDRKYTDDVVLTFNEVDGYCVIDGSSIARVDSWWDFTPTTATSETN